MGQENGGEGDGFFFDQGGWVKFCSDLERGLIFVHASLANIFNKCHKKFHELGYVKYELEGGGEF